MEGAWLLIQSYNDITIASVFVFPNIAKINHSYSYPYTFKKIILINPSKCSTFIMYYPFVL